MPDTFMAVFKVDVTCPLEHPLCGGWIKPASKIGTPLYCIGCVLQGPEAPVVLACLDWTGVLNQAHVDFTKVIAKAAHTTPERVALHCVHQHNAPFVDTMAQQCVAEQKNLPSSVDVKWFEQVQQKVAKAIEESLTRLQKVTHIQHGSAKVEKVASNRRIIGADGKISGWRASSCKDAKLRDAPEGEIDPWLRTVSFWNEDAKLISIHYYAVHPMSYYGDGVVNADFVGLAREKCSQDDGVPHLYFTGCSGNVAAGKYNDGQPERRAELAERIHKAMVESDHELNREVLNHWEWRSKPVHLPPRADLNEEAIRKVIGNAKESNANRIRAAMQLSYLKQHQARVPIILNGMLINRHIRLIHLPGECFVEYQNYARYQLAEAIICCAAYGDGGPWYIPTAAAYPQGGYEVTASWVSPESEVILQEGIKHFLRR